MKAELSSNEKLRIGLTHELNSVNTELDAMHEAYDHVGSNLEKAITERENMRTERNEWHEAFDREEIRSAEFQGKFQRLETAMKHALGL